MRQPVASRAYVVGFAVLWCGLLGAAVVAGAVAGSPAAVLPLLMLAFGAGLTYRLFRVGVLADESGLMVRNYFGTRRYRWSDAEDFRIGKPTNLPFGNAIFVQLRDGGVATLDVSMRPWFGTRGRQALGSNLDALRSWLH